MENNIDSIKKDQNIEVYNRNRIIISGVKKVISSSKDNFYCETQNDKLEVNGENLSVLKLDIKEGSAELSGLINSIIYLSSKPKLNFFKRLFK
jgi:sporulation protein YabP